MDGRIKNLSIEKNQRKTIYVRMLNYRSKHNTFTYTFKQIFKTIRKYEKFKNFKNV